MRQAIETKYFGPTDHRGARVRVKTQAFTRWVSWDHALDPQANHQIAANEAAASAGWPGPWVGGANSAGDGYVFVRLPDTFVQLPEVSP